jgi:hypothetical protein
VERRTGVKGERWDAGVGCIVQMEVVCRREQGLEQQENGHEARHGACAERKLRVEDKVSERENVGAAASVTHPMACNAKTALYGGECGGEVGEGRG